MNNNVKIRDLLWVRSSSLDFSTLVCHIMATLDERREHILYPKSIFNHLRDLSHPPILIQSQL